MIEESQNKIVGSGSMPLDKEYAQWIAELAKRLEIVKGLLTILCP